MKNKGAIGMFGSISSFTGANGMFFSIHLGGRSLCSLGGQWSIAGWADPSYHVGMGTSFGKDGISVWNEGGEWQFLVKCDRYRSRGSRFTMRDAISEAELRYNNQVARGRG